MEIASFVKSLADRYRYGIDCIIDNNDLLALALSMMPNECIEPMESCNDATNTNTVFTITCEGGNITLDSQTVTTSQIINQVNVFGKGVIIANPELKRNGTLSASVKGVGIISKPKLLPTSGTTTVTDIDGNTYNFVTIGDYDWFTSNLKVTKLNDDTSLYKHDTVNNNYDSLYAWSYISNSEPYYSWYDNNEALYKNSRGALYSKASAMNSKICPVGWEVPTYEQLYNMLISNNNSIRSTTLWSVIPNVVNSNGFNLIPNGYKIGIRAFSSTGPLKQYNAQYFDLDTVASLWTRTFNTEAYTQVIQLDKSNIIPVRFNINEPSNITQVITNNDTWNGRGVYNTATPREFIPEYIPNGNCIRCMRKKIN
jgi:uncharacterized protein (TIGR02145 family)